MLYLDFFELENEISCNSEAKELFESISQDIEEGNYKKIGVSCFLCKQPGHISLECIKIAEILGNAKSKKQNTDFSEANLL